MIKFLVVVFFVISFLNKSQAQFKEYVVKGDTALVQGEIIYDKTIPTRVVLLTIDQKQQIYDADQVTEFRLKEGIKFVSRKVIWNEEEQYVFLRVLEEGKVDFLRLKSKVNQYYLENDRLILLTETNYIRVIRELRTKCDNWKEQYKNVVFNKNSLFNFIKKYNSGICEEISKPILIRKKNGFIERAVLLKGERRKVIFEILVEGKVKFLRLNSEKNKFYLDNDSLIHIEKKNYKEVFRNLPKNCIKWQSQYKNIAYSKNSLSSFIKKYNENLCRDIPYLSFGPKIGYTFSELTIFKSSFTTSLFGDIQLESKNFNFSFFVEKPFYKIQGLSLLSEIQFQKHMYEKQMINTILSQDIKIDMSIIGLNVSPKFSIGQSKFKPYFFTGGFFNYNVNTSNEILITAEFNNQKSFNLQSDIIKFPKQYLGYNIGTGFDFNYRSNHYISIEILIYGNTLNSSTNLKYNSISVKANL